MIQLQVLPRLAIENKTVENDTLVISITSPSQQSPVIYGEHIYKFYFEDVTEEYNLPANDYRDAMIVKPMEYEIAESIAEIAWNNRDKKKWIIHCEAGISRSPGVAIGLAMYIDANPNVEKLEQQYPYYNKHVREYIEKAMDIKWQEVINNLRWNKFIGKDQ